MKKTLLSALFLLGLFTVSNAQTNKPLPKDKPRPRQEAPAATKGVPGGQATVPAVKNTKGTGTVKNNPATTSDVKAKTTKVRASVAKSKVVLKADGTPDKRFKEAQHLKKDGTPDKRYK